MTFAQTSTGINSESTKMIRGELLFNEPMSKHTSWRVGGPADVYYKPADIEDVAVFLSQQKNDLPVNWIGLGSNLLVRDGGIRGTVIVTSGLLNVIEFVGENLIRAEAGVACPKVARFAAKQDCVGAEFFAGIPGTVGGALAMNAGAFGGETWAKIVGVETIDRQGIRHKRLPEDYDINYRHVSGPKNEWFVAGIFELCRGDSETSLSKIKALLEQRNASQPTSLPSCGSVFRNPPNHYAAQLIEMADLKGVSVGGACVSDKHANFIVNKGNATAADIESLICLIEEKVRTKHKINLQREVHVMGDVSE